MVIETGLGDFSSDWILVQERVEKFTRVCTYDRAGYAWSDAGPMPRTYAQINFELRKALRKSGEHRPFVMAGHSYGGGVARSFALAYPKDTAGLVLIDSVAEDQRIPMGRQAARIADFARGRAIPTPRKAIAAGLAKEARVIKDRVDAPLDRLPVREQRMHLWAESLVALAEAEESQKDWSSESMALWLQRPQAGSLRALPLLVMTRAVGGYGDKADVSGAELEAERKRTQAALARLSSQGKQVTVDSGHNMHLEAPDAVAEGIRAVVEEWRRLK